MHSFLSLKTSIRCLLGALLVGMGVPAMVQAACAGPDDLQSADCRNWIDSDQVLFAAHEGKLFRMHFNSIRNDVLVDQGFKSLTFWLSADTRYIGYVGYTDAGFSAHVYDNADGSDHLLPVPDARLLRLEFSPDGRMLAWADSLRPDGRPTIAIMNLADRSIQSLRYPIDVHTLGDYRMTEVHWSLDSRQLLIGSVAYPQGDYYRLSLPSLAVAPIEGRFVPYSSSGKLSEAGMHFSHDGHDLTYYRQPCLQWQCSNQGQPAAGESVHIDKNHMMTVTTTQGGEQVAARGGCEQCGDGSVRVLSWLEQGQYLVYELRGATYLYGVAEGRTAKLFDPGWQFGWRDDENRAPAFP